MPITALPPHLRENDSMASGRGTDWDNGLLAYIPQHWFAFGPNSTEKIGWLTLLPLPYKFELQYRKILKLNVPIFFPVKWIRIVFPIPLPAKWRRYPLLLIGFNVQRWMNAHDQTRLKIHDYKNNFQSSFFGKRKNLKVTIEEKGVDRLVTGELAALSTDGRGPHDEKKEPADYGPSPIQYWSAAGFQITWPLHVAFQIQWHWVKIHQSFKRQIFFRAGWRWDSGDDYHDGPSFFFGLTFN